MREDRKACGAYSWVLPPPPSAGIAPIVTIFWTLSSHQAPDQMELHPVAALRMLLAVGPWAFPSVGKGRSAMSIDMEFGPAGFSNGLIYELGQQPDPFPCYLTLMCSSVHCGPRFCVQG